MKYSLKCLDTAIGVIFPTADQWPDSVSRSTRLDMAAKHCFVYPEKYIGQPESFAVFIVRTALKELAELGQITYGKTDEFGL